MKFTHYLVTRFNVPIVAWQQDKEGHVTLDNDWFQHRLDLFRKYCVPTVAHQSVNHFQWIIYYDRITHHDQLFDLEASVLDMPRVFIRPVEDMAHLLVDLKVLMSHAPTPYVISTRLDNDDGIGYDFIHTIQQHFQEQDRLLINLDGGIVYDADDKVLTRLKTEATNAFISLVEKNVSPENLLTVFGFHHTEVPEGMQVVHVQRGFHWLKIIHQRNVRSRQRGKPIFDKKDKALLMLGKIEFPIAYLKTLGYVVRRKWELWTSK